MINSQSNSVKGSYSVINGSHSMLDQIPKETNDMANNVERRDHNLPRKYGLSFLFRHLVCCSCYSSKHSNKKYKSDNKVLNKTVKRGEKKKDILTKEVNIKSMHDQENENMCYELAQDTSASNGDRSQFCEFKDNDYSHDLDFNRQSVQIVSENQKLLPVITEKNKNKKCFIIDLDETLVHSSFKYVDTADINVTVDIDGIQHKVYVHKRPYVDEFLSELGNLFECILFTASLGKYADPVTNILDPNGIFETRLFREACVLKEGNYVKDLDSIGRDINKIIILDNSPVSYSLHPKNALQIVSWFSDPSDTALKDLIPYFKDLATTPLSVSEWFEHNKPPETAGILGYPSSYLHWILMKTLSVPEAIILYHQRLHESFYHSGSSTVSRKSSTKSTGVNHESHPHHALLITQSINTSGRKSIVSQEDESNRPPVSSPVARPSSSICPDDDDVDID